MVHAGGTLIAPCAGGEQWRANYLTDSHHRTDPAAAARRSAREVDGIDCVRGGDRGGGGAIVREVAMTAKMLGGLMLGGLILAGALLAWAGAATDEKPLIGSIQGDNLYRAYCASCHGESAKGNGPMAAWLKVQPSDLTRIAARNGGKFPLARVDRIISGEETLPSGHGTRAMPVWGPVFSQVARDQDLGRVRIDNLARYLRDIQTK
jgi:mono/diheme cytochrome c family protein